VCCVGKSHNVSFSETFYQSVCYIQVIFLSGKPPAYSPQPQLKTEYIISSLPAWSPAQLRWVPPGAAASEGLGRTQALSRFAQTGVRDRCSGSLRLRTLRTNFWLIIIRTLYFVSMPAAIFQDRIPTWEVWRCAKTHINHRNLKNQTLCIPLCFKVISFLHNPAWFRPRKIFCYHYFQGKCGFSAILKFKISLSEKRSVLKSGGTVNSSMQRTPRGSFAHEIL